MKIELFLYKTYVRIGYWAKREWGETNREREREVLIITKLIDREMDKQKVNQAVWQWQWFYSHKLTWVQCWDDITVCIYYILACVRVKNKEKTKRTKSKEVIC